MLNSIVSVPGHCLFIYSTSEVETVAENNENCFFFFFFFFLFNMPEYNRTMDTQTNRNRMPLTHTYSHAVFAFVHMDY